jgi:alpha-tubulin suppressor-like RCC1 family protein
LGGPLPAVIDAAAGFKTSVFITEDGALYACGAVGHDEGEMPLHHVVGLPPCRRVWSGSSHGFLLTKDHDLLAYGKTSSGRLGCALSNDIKFVPICDATSMVVDAPGISSVEMVACGQAQSLFVFGGVNSGAPHQSHAKNSLFACGRIE